MQVTVKKGNHYSGFRFQPFLKKTGLSCIAQFTPSCIYDIGAEQSDWNKLTGFTLGCSSNSVRFGWRCNRGMIEICPYIHEDGKRVVFPRKWKKDINTEIALEIRRISDYSPGSFLFICDKDAEVFTFKKKKPYWGWVMHLYFGGTCPAPHDVNVYLDMLA